MSDSHSEKGLRHFGAIDFAKKQSSCDTHSPLKSNIITCRGCDLLLGYHSFVRDRSNKHFIVMNALLNYKISSPVQEESSEHPSVDFVLLYCMGCSGQIGIKYATSFFIFSDIVRERKRLMTAAIIALKPELTAECENLISSVNELEQLGIQITIHHFVLQKAHLQKFKLQYSYDICIIVHKEEGRLLLFDQNGLYDTVFKECFVNSQGNVLLILILSPEHPINCNLQNNETVTGEQQQKKQIAKSSVCDKQLLAEVAVNGKQPLLALLSKNQLVMTIFQQQINRFQIEFLAGFLHNAQSKPLLPTDLKNHLKFVKRFSVVDVTDSQEALLSYFIDQADDNTEVNALVEQLKHAFLFSKQYQSNQASSDEGEDEDDEPMENQSIEGEERVKQVVKQMKPAENRRHPVEEDQKCSVF